MINQSYLINKNNGPQHSALPLPSLLLLFINTN